MAKTSRGYSLLELLSTLGITGIIAALSAPAFDAVIARQAVRSNLQTTLDLLRLARSSAAVRNRRITLCTSHDGSNCSQTGNRFVLVFDDTNDNRQLDPGEAILTQSFSHLAGPVKLSVSAGRDYVRFRPIGSTIEFGTLTLCPENLDDRLASLLIINSSGRLRFGRDDNQDGIVEDRLGNNVNCAQA